VVPFFEEHGIPLVRVPAGRGRRYCAKRGRRDYELYMAVEDIEGSRTRAGSPRSNGICERFHKTLLQEFYRVALRRKIYGSPEELQADADRRVDGYNKKGPDSGKHRFGKTPMRRFPGSIRMARDKLPNRGPYRQHGARRDCRIK